MTDDAVCRDYSDGGITAPGSGVLLESRMISCRQTNAWLSSETPCPAWDDFLRGCKRGQFQQSSLWAQAKPIEGWKNFRVIFEQGEGICGGFQVLWRPTRFGSVGFVNKGPVLSFEEPEKVEFSLDLLHRVIQTYQLMALIVQPPDETQLFGSGLATRGFVPDPLTNVISSTCMVDLTGSCGAWETGIRQSRKVEIRQAIRRGVTIREGGDADIPKFFSLMSATCVRQRVPPHPASVEALRDLVRAFQPRGEVRLSFADYHGETIAGQLDLKFGRRATTWKKGWNGAHPNLHPNALLAYESLRWAERLGCECLDFAGMDRSLAESLSAQGPLTEAQKMGRDMFNLGFGAKPRLLPRAVIYWRNPLLRFAHSQAVAWPWAANRLAGLAKRLASS
jgi:lipid II:glycine glycyltransferase (peptidoglycan interpeptide bridge formation enzyme)